MFGYFAGLPDIFLAVLLLFVSLALIFAGRQLAKALAFIVTGVVVASIGATIGGGFLGIFGAILGATAGFLVGGLIGVMLLELGIGIALGYVGYSVSHAYLGGQLLPLLIGVILFVVGIALANKILEVATVVLGGVLLFDVMIAIGSSYGMALIVSIAVSLLGLWVQNTSTTKAKQSQVTKTSTQPQ